MIGSSYLFFNILNDDGFIVVRNHYLLLQNLEDQFCMIYIKGYI